MTAVGADPGALVGLGLACRRSADDLAAIRRGIEGALADAGEIGEVAAGIGDIEGWLAEQARDLRLRAEELRDADGAGNPMAAFGRGVAAGVRGLVDGVRGLGEIAFAPQIAWWRVGRAVAADGTDGFRRYAEEEHERSRATVRALREGLVEDLRLIVQFNQLTGPPLFAWRMHRDGARSTLETYAYELGSLVPDLVLTFATLGAGRFLRAARLGRAEVGRPRPAGASAPVEAPKLAIPDATRLTPAEQATAARLQRLLPDRTFSESRHEGADFVDDLGVTYDAMGDGTAAAFFNEKKVLRAIDQHLLKSNDFTVIDMTGYGPAHVAIVRRYVDGLPREAQARIIRIGF